MRPFLPSQARHLLVLAAVLAALGLLVLAALLRGLPAQALPPVIDLNSTSADLTVYGDDAGDWSGYAVAADDINGDTTDDIIGAYVADAAGGSDAGETYVIYGECTDNDADTVCDRDDSDDDNDACTDAEELAMGFDPLAWYDFYDVPVPAVADPAPNAVRNQAVTIGDVLAVLFYVGASQTCPAETTCGEALPPNSLACCIDNPNPNGVDYDMDKDGDTVADGRDYDRSPGPEPNPPWDAGLPNGAVTIGDVLAVLAQVGLDCSGAP